MRFLQETVEPSTLILKQQPVETGLLMRCPQEKVETFNLGYSSTALHTEAVSAGI